MRENTSLGPLKIGFWFPIKPIQKKILVNLYETAKDFEKKNQKNVNPA
jgi:hypothetical protein